MKKPTPLPRRVQKRRPAGEQDKMIVDALRGAGRPVSAYEIIDQLRAKTTLAPQTVYRALERLIAAGSAHRLESLNAFVACSHAAHAGAHSGSAHSGAAVFAICDDCGTVTEFEEARAVDSLAAWARKQKFAVSAMTLELRGRCGECGGRGD